MLEESHLAEQFEHLLTQTRQMEEFYAELAKSAGDSELRGKIEHLLRDKHRHILLAERLLEIVQ